MRTATVSHDGTDSWVVSGVHGLTVLNTAGSEFWGFARDRYTTLAETTDRILATAVRRAVAARQPRRIRACWADSYRAARDLMLGGVRRHAQLFAAADAVRHGRSGCSDGRPEIAEIRLSLPNKHHFEVDMSPFGLENGGEVFYAADRPYGLIEGTVTRDDAPPPGKAW